MRRKSLFRVIITLLVLVWSGIALFPTFQLGQQKNSAENYYQSIEENTSLNRNDIKAALSTANLELQVRNNYNGDNGKSVEDMVQDVQALIALDEEIVSLESRAIKLGLDLQGGTYLVYEVDLPQLLRNVAKETDTYLEDAIAKTSDVSTSENIDFFEAVQQVFSADSLRMNRYFGRIRDTDDQVIDNLRKEAEDAVERTLEVLRNRIDQFGVSEPSITKQGSRRIVVELAGIQDVERAKNIIGTTALLEFQLEKEAEVISSVLDDINRIVKEQTARGEAAISTEDSSSFSGQVTKDVEVSLKDVFGDAAVEEGAEPVTDQEGEDSTVVVAEELFDDRPFDAMLKNLNNDIAVPTSNVRTVERIINSPEVVASLPRDAEFLLHSKSQPVGDQEYYLLYMLKKEPELVGSMISNAYQQFGSELQAGQAIVNMELTNDGAKVFSRVTAANVGKRLAIVLDGKVVSIPNINERIPSGRAQISGMGSIQEAEDLAIVLRAGALPAPIEVIEERTVGPSLGQDSINKGTYSALVGLTVVAIFMVLYYRASGFVADFALLLNIFIIMAVLAGFHATLTLPGVAGIILTIGMAVDANVLIFERIREELRNGKTVRAAIDSGYERAFKTILDANVTTLLTALVLYQFGTGPIRGFALTLSIGIVASMFTAILVTRLIFDYITDKYTLSKLSI